MNAQITPRAPGMSDRSSISLEEAVALIRTPQEFQNAQAESQAAGQNEHQQVSPESLTVIVDMPALLSRCLGNMELVKRVLTKFQTSGTSDLQQIQAALARSDFDTIAQISHRLKGAAGNVSASRLRLLATYIEQSAREKSFSEIGEVFTQLCSEWELFLQFASEITSQKGVSPTGTVVRPR